MGDQDNNKTNQQGEVKSSARSNQGDKAKAALAKKPTERRIVATLRPDQLSLMNIFRANRFLIILVGILIIASFARLNHLDEKPFHHDESLYSKYYWLLWKGHGYEYDPMQHGPWQFHWGAFIFFLFGDSDWTARLTIASISIFFIWLLSRFRPFIGESSTLILCSLTAISPIMMYYGRMVREDPHFLFFNTLLPLAYLFWLRTKKNIYLYITVASFAMLYCIKENAFVSTLIFISFAVFYAVFETFIKKEERDKRRWTKKLQEVIVQHSFITKLIFVVVLWGTFFFLYAIGHIKYSTLYPLYKWDKYVQTYFGVVYAIIAFIIGYMVYIGEKVRLERNKEKYLGLPAEFYRDGRIFAIGFGIFVALCVTLYTSFGSSIKGFWGGAFKWFPYWWNQHSIHRIQGPFHYYIPHLVIYEVLPLMVVLVVLAYRMLKEKYFALASVFWLIVSAVVVQSGWEKHPFYIPDAPQLFKTWHFMFLIWILGAGTWATLTYFRDRLYLRAFFVWWLVTAFAIYSYLQEKIPWMNQHILLPLILLAAIYIGDLFKSKLPAPWRVAAWAGIFVLSLYTVHSAFLLSWRNEADPREQMVYVQTHPDICLIVDEIETITRRLGTGKQTKIYIQGDAAWPMSWYLRDYTIPYVSEVTTADAPIIISDWEKKDEYLPLLTDYIPRRHQLRCWWIPEWKHFYEPNESFNHFMRKVMRYLLYREMFHPEIYGSKDIIFWVRRDLYEWNWNNKYGGLKTTAKTREQTTAQQVTIPEGQIQRIKLTRLLHFGNRGVLAGQFQEPKGITVDKQGNIYVIDGKSARVQKFSPQGRYIKGWGEPGKGEGEFDKPCGIYYDPVQDLVYVADTWNHRIQVFDTEGKFQTLWGDSTMFWAPKDVITDKYGDVYVVDTGYHRIHKFNGKNYKEIIIFGQKGNNERDFFEPVGITIKDNTLYIADTANSAIKVYDTNGKFQASYPVPAWTENYYSEPYIAVDKQGNLLVTDAPGARLILVDANSGEVLAFAGKRGADPSQFKEPKGLTIDNDGNIYVTDMQNFRVIKFAPLSY